MATYATAMWTMGTRSIASPLTAAPAEGIMNIGQNLQDSHDDPNAAVGNVELTNRVMGDAFRVDSKIKK